MEISKNTINQIKADLDAALAAFTEKTGIIAEIGTISYDANGFTCRITATAEGLSEEKQFQINARKNRALAFDGPIIPYGTIFRTDDHEYMVCGIFPHGKSYPYQIRDTATRKTYKASGLMIRHSLGKEQRKVNSI